MREHERLRGRRGDHRGIRELEVGITQDHERGWSLRPLDELHHRTTDTAVTRWRREDHVAVLTERRIDEVLDEHPLPGHRDDELAEA